MSSVLVPASVRSFSLRSCNLCRRQCGVDRTAGGTGFCRTDAGLNIAAITPHRGEEPAICGSLGICNVFFGHCNLRCRFCQNHQISANEQVISGTAGTPAQAADAIAAILGTGVAFGRPSSTTATATIRYRL